MTKLITICTFALTAAACATTAGVPTEMPARRTASSLDLIASSPTIASSFPARLTTPALPSAIASAAR